MTKTNDSKGESVARQVENYMCVEAAAYQTTGGLPYAKLEERAGDSPEMKALIRLRLEAQHFLNVNDAAGVGANHLQAAINHAVEVIEALRIMNELSALRSSRQAIAKARGQ